MIYLVLDERALVAAFAMRDDAEHWIQACGNSAMELRKNRAIVHASRSKAVRKDKPRHKTGGALARRR